MYRYTEADDFEILLFAYKADDGPVQVIDLANGELMPSEVMDALINPSVLKTAYNAPFERTCIAKHFGIPLPPEEWECTMVRAAMAGLPMGLDAAAAALRVPLQKMNEGKTLIRYFCVPCKPSKANGGRTRNMPWHDEQKWERFKEYNRIDVEVESEIREAINYFTIPAKERLIWQLDQRINDRGIRLDRRLIDAAIRMDTAKREQLLGEAAELTGLDNPNSVAQLKDWLEKAMDEEIQSLNKKELPELLRKADSKIVRRVLQIRQELAKTSVKKYAAMRNAICRDGRGRGLVQFYGAGRTGRWAGRLIQVHNLLKNTMKDLGLARQLVLEGDMATLELVFGSVLDTLGQLIRTAFIPSEGNALMPGDFSAIEARVLAYLAGEKWRLDVFNTHGKIYEASAAQMFRVPIESIKKGSPMRDKGKIAELALGYQGGVNALKVMGALDMGLQENELQDLVSAWRNANKKIRQYWYDAEAAAIEAVETGDRVTLGKGISFQMKNNTLFVHLPSGRSLSYLRPKLIDGKFGKVLSYEGTDDKKKWTRIETYGGKIVENIVQAYARDLLADAMLRLDEAGYQIVLHVHDEAVPDHPNSRDALEEIEMIMSTPIPWAKGLPLRAEVFSTPYYKKD